MVAGGWIVRGRVMAFGVLPEDTEEFASGRQS